MVEILIEYQGDLRCESRHTPSSRTLPTDAPVDNCGKGESFSPTDLVATALGSCILTTMGIAAQKRGLPFERARAKVTKSMVADPKRRIGTLAVELVLPKEYDDKTREVMQRIAHTCPVAASLSDSIEVPVEFSWTA